jgi:hypothetical protein
MSFPLAGYPTSNYIGAVYSQPMQIAGNSGRAVKLTFNWLAYGASSNNQNIVVNIQLSAGSPSQVAPMLDLIRSIYIDNTGSPDAVYVQFPDTGFTIVAQPNSIGWYPVFTNAFLFMVAVFGITNANIPQCTMYVTNVKVDAFTDVAIAEVTPQNLASPALGGGSSIFSITPVINGQDYNTGALAVTGGGGNGAAAHGILDQWGRFINVVIDDPGVGFTGIPTVTPTGGQTVPPAFTGANNLSSGQKVSYQGTEWQWLGGGGLGGSIQCGAAGWVSQGYANTNQVNYSGFIFQAIQNVPNGVGAPPGAPSYWRQIGSATPAGGSGGWLNSGTAAGTLATFSTLLSASSNPIVSNGLGIPALGDQATNYIDAIAGAGVFRQNLFGTPYDSGFIYVTHIFVSVLLFGAGNTWIMEDVLGYAPFTFKPGATGVQLELQKMNMKLDATSNWQLNCTTFAAAISVQHAFAFTYAQQ